MRAGIDRVRLAQAIQATILTSIDEYMGPSGGAYRKAWDDLSENERQHILRDADALIREYESADV